MNNLFSLETLTEKALRSLRRQNYFSVLFYFQNQILNSNDYSFSSVLKSEEQGCRSELRLTGSRANTLDKAGSGTSPQQKNPDHYLTFFSPYLGRRHCLEKALYRRFLIRFLDKDS